MRTKFRILITSIILVLAFVGCNNEENELDSPGVQTLGVQNVTATNVTLHGKLSMPSQTASDFEFGFEISMDSVFDDESTTRLISKYYNEDNEFTHRLENLRPGKVYYYRAYMINQMSMRRGEIKSFTTDKLVGPNVLTLYVQDVTETKALLFGLINAPDPVASDFEFGFEISMDSVFADESTTRFKSGYYNEGNEFTYRMEDLRPGKVYYYRAYMINQMSMYRGEIKSFTTGKLVGPNVLTLYVQDVTETKALLFGLINAPDPVASDFEFGYEISMDSVFTDEYTTRFKSEYYDEKNEFTYQLGHLHPNTIYYYRTYMINQMMMYRGKIKSFTTNDIELSDGEICNLTCYSAMITAMVSPEEEVSSYGIFYGTNDDPVHNGIRISGSLKDAGGRFACQLYSLTGATTYYYCTYAYSHEGEPWKTGSVNTFTTKDDDVVETGTIDTDTYFVTSKINLGEGLYQTLRTGVCYSNQKKIPTVEDSVVYSKDIDSDGGYSVVLTYVTASTTVNYRALAMIDGVPHYGETKSFESEGNGKEKGYSYVDLGLSVMWATCNVGATSPEDYGEYYAWGEAEIKDSYYWGTYKYGPAKSLTKYCTVDGKEVLESEDDVAHVKWGGDWRMPTEKEQDELLTECTWTWTIQNSVNGYLVTSKKEGYTNRSIFLPAAGYRENTSLLDAGSIGCYWSSRGYSSSDVSGQAYYLSFNSGSVRQNRYARCYGRSVRPVCPSSR